MDEKIRLQARELLLRSRIYRFVALCFAAIGLVIFIILYFRVIDGDIMQALRKPSFIVITIVPFLPAFILSRMSIRAGNKLMKLLENIQQNEK
ncbi:MAG: hypothetical protein CO093_04455 [Alphaproteobacteria bacterium CG_4_9_14_3_um_filter_47_13]|nr:MAG: hypothetical protein CO093_04455 [Alphaproteobacteria bacterium CG_4_9_14_3_um_filter_47_13]